MSADYDNAKQYADSRKLAARARLIREYTITETPWFPWVARQLALNTGDQVLDIGCGPGWFWASVADVIPPGLHLTLADLSQGMVGEAVERCNELPFASVVGREADAVASPFEDASFDVVVAMHMLYHVADPALAIAEAFRVLKSGGLLAVTTNGAGNTPEIYALRGAAFGCAPFEPVSAMFGFDIAEHLMRSQFGNVSLTQHPAKLRITDAEDVFWSLTSYPPGDSASELQQQVLREAIAQVFEQGNGVLETQNQSGLFLSRKETDRA